MFELVIFDFDGTLFDTHASIEHCIKGTFDCFQPQKPADAEAVRQLISKGTGLYDTFEALKPDPAVYDEKEWESKYRELYATEGQGLIKAFPGCKELLVSVKELGIPAAIVTNKGVMAVHAALNNHGLADLVSKELIVGDKTPGNVTRKPDPGCYVNVLRPALEARGIHGLDPAKVLVVGDTEADIRLAQNIGARSCWCSYGYGSTDSCLALRPNSTVDSLIDVRSIL